MALLDEVTIMGSRPVTRDAFVTAGDLYDRSADTSQSWLQEDIPPATKVIQGVDAHIILRDDLSVHYSDTEELDDLVIETEMPEHIGVRIMLEGKIDASLDDQPIPMPQRQQGSGGWKPIASIYCQTRPAIFRRSLRKGDRVRKVIITFKHDWLLDNYPDQSEELDQLTRFTRTHLACKSWQPSQAALTCAEQILSPPMDMSLLRHLYIESRALHLITEAFQQILPRQKNRTQTGTGLRQQDRQRLSRLETYLEQTIQQPIRAADLAQAAGTSINTLQRLCQAAHGTSLADYVTRWKLDKARHALEFDGVTIAEAAFLAGYGSPANFSTAFKRHFGISPSEVTRGW